MVHPDVDIVCPRPRRFDLREVARVYLAPPAGLSPRQAVAKHFGIRDRTLDRWLNLTREAGLIPPATPRPVVQRMAPEDCWVCDEVEFLLDAGEVKDRIAERLGYNTEALMRHMRRHDHPQYDRFVARGYPTKEEAS